MLGENIVEEKQKIVATIIEATYLSRAAYGGDKYRLKLSNGEEVEIHTNFNETPEKLVGRSFGWTGYVRNERFNLLRTVDSKMTYQECLDSIYNNELKNIESEAQRLKEKKEWADKAYASPFFNRE